MSASVEKNLGVDPNDLMAQVEGLKSTAESQFGTLDPNELVALAKQKVDTEAIMAKL